MTAAPPITERDFQRQVTDLAHICGWEDVHFRPAQTQHGWRTPVQGRLGAGWPDLVLVRVKDRRILFVELKRDRMQLTADQVRVMELLADAGQECYVWRPADFERIAEALR